MKKFLLQFLTAKVAFRPAYANDLDAFVPEVWALEGVAILEENMVAANLIHRK